MSDGYWIGGLIDLAFGLEDDGLGLSWYGLGFGACLSLLTALGTAYAHKSLNLYHQPDNHHQYGGGSMVTRMLMLMVMITTIHIMQKKDKNHVRLLLVTRHKQMNDKN